MSDLISRSTLIAEVEKSMRENPHKDVTHKGCHVHEHNHFLCMIARQPAVEAAPVVHGEWIYENYTWYCSECGNHPYKGYTPAVPDFIFCPNCGADMRKKVAE